MTMTKRKRCWRIASILGGLAALWGVYTFARPDDEVALTIGQPYEQVRLQSRSTLPPAEPSGSWLGYVTRPAVFRLTDPQYGFVTPASKFLAVRYDDKGNVWGAILSPQIKSLPLDESMAILLDLQNQLRRGGWAPFQAHRYQPIEDTPAVRAEIRACNDPYAYWLSTKGFQISLDIRCFRTEARPNDERYLITVDLHQRLHDFPEDRD